MSRMLLRWLCPALARAEAERDDLREEIVALLVAHGRALQEIARLRDELRQRRAS